LLPPLFGPSQRVIGQDSQVRLAFLFKKQPRFIDLFKGGEYNIGEFSLLDICPASVFCMIIMMF
jgi:hypothetical protein